MDWISILGVFGTIATLIFGIYSIVLAYKRNVTGTLMFIEESYIDFQDVMIQNSKSLKIFYENEEIQNETYLLRGFFISRGKEDITTQMIEKNIKIILPHGKKRLMSKIISKSQDLIAELNICDNVLELNSGLIKYNEYVYFEGLIDSDKTKLQAEEIKFEHRIANTTSIIRKKVDDFKNLIQASLSLLFLSFMFIFFVGNPIKVNEYQLNGSFVDSKNHQINYNKKHLEGLVASLESYKIREKIYSDYNKIDFIKNNETKLYDLKDGNKVKFTYKIGLFELIMEFILGVFYFGLPLLTLFFLYFYFTDNDIDKIITFEVNKRKE